MKGIEKARTDTETIKSLRRADKVYSNAAAKGSSALAKSACAKGRQERTGCTAKGNCQKDWPKKPLKGSWENT